MMGWVGAAYVVCRLLGKIVGGRLGVRWVGKTHRVGDQVGSALLCQAAVVIGLASFVRSTWNDPLAEQFATVVLGSVVLFELIGPLAIKRCVVRQGEVKAFTLLRRGGSLGEGSSIFRLTLQSLLRTVGIGTGPKVNGSVDMRVQHIMRTNVWFLRASATYDEVLHFIERSTYSHFPVVDDDDSFVGVVHFNDVREAIYDPITRDLVTAVDLADPASAVVPMDMTLADLLDVFHGQDVGVLPVTERADSRHIVGIVEQRDLLRALHLTQADGMDRAGGGGARGDAGTA